MRTLSNAKLTNNFSRYEIIEGAVPALTAMNWKHIDEYQEAPFITICHAAERIRAIINVEFISDIDKSKPIGLRVTSGWRCLAWELHRGRSGGSKHTDNDGNIAALDLQPTNCSKELAVKIIEWLDKLYSPRQGLHVWRGGWAVKKPTIVRGVITKVGFFHIDNRPVIARWSY